MPINPYNTKITNHWQTPPDLYKELNDEFKFTFDPVPLYGDSQKGNDGLTKKWGKRNFVNPPYSDIAPWAKKAREEQLKGNLSVLLIPSRTSTKYFHEWILPYAELRFIEGRVKFMNEKGEIKNRSPWPSMLAIYRP
eukprot:Lithocolla_globosa_v1_NODE_1945_length_2247_cov_4.583485.p2 type:complete len:137 gc:universal NODE_1945_length_2247_cov_4.583485:2084-1674(-)